MVKRFKKWLFQKFLPAWCKEKLIEENEALTKRVAELEHTVQMQQSYIDGMKYGLRASRKIKKPEV